VFSRKEPFSHHHFLGITPKYAIIVSTESSEKKVGSFQWGQEVEKCGTFQKYTFEFPKKL